MEGGAAAATIEVLVQNLINVAADLDKDAQKLKTSLSMIQSYLNDAEKKFIAQEAVKTWINELEAVAFDADHVLDELSYHLLSNKVNKLMSLKHKVLSFFSSFNHISRPSKLAHQIKDISITLDSINKRATQLRLIEAIDVSAPAPPAAAETDSFTVDPIFIGRVDDVPQLVEKLIERAGEQKFSILSLVGMGGMGKTTLTRKVFNHQKMKAQFGSLIWVHVSQTFDQIILFKKILASLLSQTDHAESREDILEKLQKSLKVKTDEVESREVILIKLQEALKAKPCLVVLDDVWNQDLQKWEDFMNSLSGVTSVKGNGIIVTTRNTEVASIVNPLHIHQLNPLSDEECWSIIKAKTSENGDHVPLGFESIGRKIAKRCQGLPLAANVVGGVLRSKSEDEWLSIQENWLPDVEGDNNISKILRLSFDNLSSPSLKKCFAYCSIFPKGERIEKQELIELWMAEGFLQADKRHDMESVGNNILNVLLHNSLLLVAPRDVYSDVDCILIHDLVHDLACSISGCYEVDENINSNGISRVRYYRQHKSSGIPKEVAKYLRTLWFEGELCGTMFLDFECLHVLTLTSDQVEEFPISIKQLIHLRNLNISNTCIRYLPEWIGELHHLQTLRAETKYLRKLPSTFKYLINLRHLYIRDDVELLAEIGRLTCLQTLRHFRVGNNKGYKIEELGSLKNLKGKLKISNLEKVHDKEEAVKANIFHKPDLLDLQFEWSFQREGDEINDESVLEGLQPHPNLKVLSIKRFKGKRFPLWTQKMSVRDNPEGSWVGLNRLTVITLLNCRECEEIPALGHLPNLKSLYLVGLSNVQSINSSFYKVYNIGDCKETTINVFPVLESLTLVGMPKLREWAEVESGPNCEVKPFPHLQHLQIIDLSHIVLMNIFEIKLTLLTTFSIKDIDELECLPDWLFYNNQNLSKLEVDYCPKLRELPDGLHTLNSLEELIIKDCPNLKLIGQSQGSLTSLRSLKIDECPELMDFPYEMVESLAPSLQTLSLVGLKTLPRVLDCLIKPTPNSCSEILTFRSLRELEMDVSVDTKETVDAILQGCSYSLLELKLRGMENLECLPESIQHLTVLYSLELQNFGMEELPEWFGNLSSLMFLDLSNCNNLRRLLSLDAMQHLTKLRSLYINDCSNELRIDPKYLKISNLSIHVDGDILIDQPSTQ
ncbi:hypothetical protein C2S51_020893 [Perilla frutescens var. frutescens]|nr:hypothetical protein C2S51_020893 [Perilla frutescens var. frutescens]